LSFAQDDIRPRGHAIECRVYAEDPANNFLPSIGRVQFAEEPRAPGVRVDAGVSTGCEVTRFYDPLIAKVIAHADTRADAITKMDCALADYTVLGVTTNIAFLRDVLATDAFRRGEVTTHFVDEAFANWSSRTDVPDEVLLAAALTETGERKQMTSSGSNGEAHDPWLVADGFRMGQG
ncbi:MAG: acetyl-CoA carboxylase biotin carboxylase subunit, partial [Chloroflexi bacterium]|nr:acetyl-CoA carboxylase biotin carboxylase subunit [Chloroflexota bacterium]